MQSSNQLRKKHLEDSLMAIIQSTCSILIVLLKNCLPGLKDELVFSISGALKVDVSVGLSVSTTANYMNVGLLI